MARKTRPVKIRVECPDCLWRSGWIPICVYADVTAVGRTFWIVECPDCGGRECEATDVDP